MIDLKISGKTIIAMIHVGALPGTPCFSGNIYSVIEQAVAESKIYLECGVDSILIENMHDVPYVKGKAGGEIVAAMSVIANEIRKLTAKPLGIQILAGANEDALAVAFATNLDYIRAEGFVYGHLADEGFFESCAGELLRYRRKIGAEHIAVYTDVKKKHASHFLTSDISLEETIKTAEYFLSDGIIITGNSTGLQPLIEDVKMASESTNLPIFIGSGISAANLKKYWNDTDAFIIGSHFKTKGDWRNSVDKDRVMNFMSEVQILRSKQ